MEAAILPIQPTNNWREDEAGRYIASKNYNSAIQMDSDDKILTNSMRVKLTQKQLNHLDYSKIQPGDILYHKEQSYVKVCQIPEYHKLSEASLWEFFKLKEKQDDEEQAKGDLERIWLTPKQFSKVITIQTVLLINDNISISYQRLLITARIRDIIEPLQQLYNSNVIAIWNSKYLNLDWALYDYGIKDGDRVQIFGVKAIPSVKRSAGRMRFYKRFATVDTTFWSVGRGINDQLIVVPRRDVRIMGIGIFEYNPPNTNPFTIGYKYVLKDENEVELESQPEIEEEVVPSNCVYQDHIIQHKFTTYPNGILVRAGHKWQFSQWIHQGTSNLNSYVGMGGRNYHEIPNDEPDALDFQISWGAPDPNQLERGLIPGVLYM